MCIDQENGCLARGHRGSLSSATVMNESRQTVGGHCGSSQVTLTAPERFAKLQLRVGGMACSFCVTSIGKALGRMPGVRSVNVNLAHEEALVEFDPRRVTPDALQRTLVDLGYTVRNPDRLRAFEEEEAELRQRRDDLLVAAAFALVSFAAMGLMWLELLPPEGMAALYWLMPFLALSTVFGPGWHVLEMAWASHDPGRRAWPPNGASSCARRRRSRC